MKEVFEYIAGAIVIVLLAGMAVCMWGMAVESMRSMRDAWKERKQ